MSKLFASREVRLRGVLECPERDLLYNVARKLERNFNDWLFVREGVGIGIFLTIDYRLGSATINLTNFKTDDEKRAAPRDLTTIPEYIEVIRKLLQSSFHPCLKHLKNAKVNGNIMIELPDRRYFRVKLDNRTEPEYLYTLELCVHVQKQVEFIADEKERTSGSETDDSGYGSV